MPPSYNNCFVSKDKIRRRWRYINSGYHVTFEGQKPYEFPSGESLIGKTEAESSLVKSHLSSRHLRFFWTASGHFSQLKDLPFLFNSA